MKITIDISDKLVKTIVEQALDAYLFCEYNEGILKKAKVPSRKSLAELIFKDKKVMADLQKHTEEFFYHDDEGKEIVETAMGQSDAIYHAIESFVDACEDHRDEEEKHALLKEEQRENERMIRRLKAQGYNITKLGIGKVPE